MLETYFFELAPKSCSQSLPKNGFRFPLPSTGLNGAIDIIETRTIVMMQNQQYPSTSDAIFLPYVKNNINLCFQLNKDVLSAPFSGCHMVRFKVGNYCLVDKIRDNCGITINCNESKLGCFSNCKYRQRYLVGHVAYEDDQRTTCKDLWEKGIKPYCIDFIDFDPFSSEAVAWINNNKNARVHGLITESGRMFSIGIDYNDKIVFIWEYLVRKY